LGLSEDCYSIIPVSGGTESYLSIDDFDYCDAIVESGRTIKDNNLKIVKVLAESIQAALYTLI
jgi:ATP phosphoribosyltransferase